MASIALPRRVLVGAGKVNELGSLLSGFRLTNPLVVADPFFQNHSALESITSKLGKHDVFFDVVPDPTTDSVNRCLEKFLSKDFDSLVALGGGSAMDTAKAAGVLAKYKGQMRDYKAPKLTDGESVPLVCIPTTAGTGSEVTRFTIVTDSATGEKMLCAGLAFLPIAAIVDYKLTITTNYRLTADSGIDAFCHAMEAYVSRKRNDFSDGLALTAISRIANNLRLACEQPDNQQAREAMMLAATEAGMAFSNASVTLIHGLSRPLGANFHVPHGLSNAMLAPTVTHFSLPGAVDRYAQVARAAQFSPSIGCSDEDAAESLPKGLSHLCRDLQVPLISEFGQHGGVSEEDFTKVIPKMATDAIASGSPNNNPVIPTHEQIQAIYRNVYSGTQF